MQNIDIHSYIHQHKLSSSSTSSSSNSSNSKGGMFKGHKDNNKGPTSTEELWENQTYIPLRGWGTPYSVLSHYTDKFGEKSLSNDNFPDIPLPTGWEWSTKWTIDTSQSFGDTDIDGWCYDVTFDRLINSIKFNTTSKEELSSSLVRRRRWIRERICTSDEAKAHHQEQIDYLLSSLTKIEAALSCKKQDYDTVIQYENERFQAYENTMKMFYESIQLTLQEIKEYKIKIEYMKEFLTLQSKFDKEYSSRLEALSVRFCPDTAILDLSKPSENIITNDRDSVSIGEISHFLNAENTTNLSPKPIKSQNQLINEGADLFLSGISQASATSSRLWNEFASVVGGGMIQDVDEMLEKIAEFIKSSQELSELREQMKPLEAKVKETSYAIKLSYQAAFLRGHAITGDINLRISGGQTRYSSESDHSKIDRVIDDTNLVNKVNESSESSTEIEDMWLCIRYYRQAVVELSHYLQSYRKKVNKFTEEKDAIGHQIKLLFVTTMQSYCHDRSRIFLESTEYLKKSRQSMMEWNIQTDMSQLRILSNSTFSLPINTNEIDSKSSTSPLTNNNNNTNTNNPTSDPTSDDNNEINNSVDRSIQAIDSINTSLNVLEQTTSITSNAMSILNSLKLETPLASLPNGSEQILVQSIMQYTTTDKANKILSYMKDDQKKGNERRSSLLGDSSFSNSTTNNESFVPSLADFISVKVVATADGILHLFPLEEKKSSRGGDYSKPFKSIKLEGCKIIQQPPTNGLLANAVEIHPPKAITGILSTAKKVESIILVPIDEDEACNWIDILCDPLCGGSLLIPLIPGSVHLSYENTSPSQVDEIFITVPPESLKPKRKTTSSSIPSSSSSSSGTRRKSTRRNSYNQGNNSKATSTLMEQSDSILEEAKALMNATNNTVIINDKEEDNNQINQEENINDNKIDELKL